MVLTIIGWVLLLISFYFRSNHSEKRFGNLFDVRRAANGLNFSAFFCFIFSILISLFFTNLNITI